MDKISKKIVIYFNEIFMHYFDLDYEVEYIYTNEIVSGENKISADFIAKLKNGKYLIIEFEKSSFGSKKMRKHLSALMNLIYLEDEDADLVIIGYDNPKYYYNAVESSKKINNGVHFRFVWDKDGTEIYNNIKTKVDNNKEFDENDFLNFILLPFMKVENMENDQIIEELCYLTNKISIDEDMLDFIKSCQYLTIDLLIKDCEKKDKLLEVVKMGFSAMERLIKWENNIEQKTNMVKDMERDINNRVTEVDNREAEINNREFEVNNKEVEVNNKEVEVNNKEVEVNNREFEVNNKEVEVNNREFEVNNKEVEVNNREFEVNNKENMLVDKENKLAMEKGELDNEKIKLEIKENDIQKQQEKLKIEKEKIELQKKALEDEIQKYEKLNSK